MRFDPSGGRVRYGDLEVVFGESAGATLGAIATPLDLSSVSVLITQLGTDATVHLNNLGGGNGKRIGELVIITGLGGRLG